MKTRVQVKQCKNCNHCIENKYCYYTHDNRMVECYLYTCQKDEKIFQLREICIEWEQKEESLG